MGEIFLLQCYFPTDFIPFLSLVYASPWFCMVGTNENSGAKHGAAISFTTMIAVYYATALSLDLTSWEPRTAIDWWVIKTGPERLLESLSPCYYLLFLLALVLSRLCVHVFTDTKRSLCIVSTYSCKVEFCKEKFAIDHKMFKHGVSKNLWPHNIELKMLNDKI